MWADQLATYMRVCWTFYSAPFLTPNPKGNSELEISRSFLIFEATNDIRKEKEKFTQIFGNLKLMYIEK